MCLPIFSITRVTQAPLCSLQRITSTRWSHTSHLKSVNAYLWEHNIPLRAYQPCSVRNDSPSLTPRLTAPPQTDIPSATVTEYFNVIISSPLFQESTHPGVASALCSTLGTTPYFSVSLSLLVVRVQVALHL